MVYGIFTLPQASCLLLVNGFIALFPHLLTKDSWVLQKQLLGHALVSLSDMVAVLGETTGCLALPNLRDKMKNHPEGYRILQCVPPHPSHLAMVCGREAHTRPSRFLGPGKGELGTSTSVLLALTLQVNFIFNVHRSPVTHLRAGLSVLLRCWNWQLPTPRDTAAGTGEKCRDVDAEQ